MLFLSTNKQLSTVIESRNLNAYGHTQHIPESVNCQNLQE